MNVVTLVGNLTRDPYYIDAEKGKIAKFDLATKVGYDSEKKEDRTEFVPVTAFGISEAFQPYLKKGRAVSIHGRVGTDKFEKDGEMQYRTHVKVFNGSLRLVGANPDKSEQKPAQPAE